jgi:hypothetical protein
MYWDLLLLHHRHHNSPYLLSPNFLQLRGVHQQTKTCTLTPSLIEVEDTPQQIEGPYFVDDMSNRSNIRSETSDGSMQEGIPLHLILHIYGVDDNDGDGIGSCTPLNDAKVDIWHANSQGVYSGVQDAGTGQNNFLRGYQVTDDNGTVRLPQFIQAGMKAEPFTYMSRFEPSRDQMKPWNGHRSFTLTILSMKRSILNLHTTDMGVLIGQMKKTLFILGPRMTVSYKLILANI